MARRRCVTWHWRMPGASAGVHVGVLISELNPPRLASLGCQGDGLLPAAAEGVQGQFVLGHRGLDFKLAVDPDLQVLVHRSSAVSVALVHDVLGGVAW